MEKKIVNTNTNVMIDAGSESIDKRKESVENFVNTTKEVIFPQVDYT